MLGLLMRRVSRTRAGIALLTGAASMLEGLERVLSTRPVTSKVAAAQPVIEEHAAAAARRPDRFRIYRTGSDLGYSYWVLQGSGAFQCFALFDSWNQAMIEAERRIAVARRLATPPARLQREVLTVPR